MRTIAFIAALCLLFGTANQPAFADTTSPGKTTVAASGVGLAMAFGSVETSMLTAELSKGKSKRILTAQAMIANVGGFGTDRHYSCRVLANGLELEPGAGNGFNGASTANAAMTVSFWLDLDDPANVALVGAVITVDLRCTETTGLGDFDLRASLTAALAKK